MNLFEEYLDHLSYHNFFLFMATMVVTFTAFTAALVGTVFLVYHYPLVTIPTLIIGFGYAHNKAYKEFKNR